MIKRLDRLEVASTDLGDATSLYQRNFGFNLRQAPDGETAVLAIGDAEIHLVSGSQPSAKLAPGGEGMAALWLEADDVAVVAQALEKASLKSEPVRKQGGRRILAVDPQASNQVPLFIFDRKG
ncbi:MAG: VOC family protein [Candidatus Binataceae bacterium]|jgi:predicted enzyme related to lactoylglutathione lyase